MNRKQTKKYKKAKIMRKGFIAGAAANDKRGILLGVASIAVGFIVGRKTHR